MNIEKSCGLRQNPKGEGLQKMSLSELRSVLQALDKKLYLREKAGTLKRVEVCKLISKTNGGKKYFNTPEPVKPKAVPKKKPTGPVTKKEIENLLNNMSLPKRSKPPKNGNYMVNIGNLGFEFDENSGEVVNVFQMNANANNNGNREVNYGNENGSKYANVVFDPRNRRNRRTEKDPLRAGVLTKAQAKLFEPKAPVRRTKPMQGAARPLVKFMNFGKGNRVPTNPIGGLAISTRPRFNPTDMRNARAIAGRMVNSGVTNADKALADAINIVMDEKTKGVRVPEPVPVAAPSFNLISTRANMKNRLKRIMVKKEPMVRKPLATQLMNKLNELPGAKVVVKK